MKRALPLVVFDLDGTLVDSSADLAAGANAMLSRVAPGTATIPVEVIRSFIGNGARNLVAKTLAHTGAPVSPEEALPVFIEEYAARLTDSTRFYPGVEETLERLSGATLAVLTNKPGDMSRRILETLGAGDRFFRVYGGGDLPSRKPDAAGLLKLMEEAGATARETVMVGDSAIDVRTGRAAGVVTVGVTYGFDAESLAAEPPDAVLHSLADLPDLLGRLRAAVLP